MAKNQRYPHSRHIALTATKAVKSGDPVKIGAFVGVAQTEAKAGEKVTVWLDGSYMLTVKEATTEGAIVNIADDGTLTTGAGKPFGIVIGGAAAGAPVEVAPFGKLQAGA